MGNADVKNPKADDGNGISIVLREATPITTGIKTSNNRLKALLDIEQIAQQGDLLTLNHKFSTNGSYHEVDNQAALLLKDNTGKPVNFALFNINGNERPVIPYDTNNFACVIGDLDGEWWAAQDEAEAADLYNELVIRQRLNVTVLMSIDKYQFKDMLLHFGKVKTINVTTTHDNKKPILKTLAGTSTSLLLTTFGLVTESQQGRTLADVKADPESDIIDMQAANWSEPDPLASDPSKPTTYPIDAWQGLLRQVIESIAYHAQVPLAMAGQCVLGALSHLGQAFVDAPMGHEHMPASLYLITEGESGSGKSTAMRLSHYEIKAYEKEQYQVYLERLNEWEADKTSLKGSELKEFLTNEPKPNDPITMFGDATIEPILDKYIDGQMTNASWSTDEAGQFFGGHTMKGDTSANALSALTILHSDGEAGRTRSQKSQHANPRSKAYDVRMTLLLMGQRVVLEQALTDPMMNGQGFLARTLIACPESLQGKRVWNDAKRRQQSPYNNTDLIAYWERCRQLLDPAPINDPQQTNSKQRLKMRWQDAETEQTFFDGMQVIENRQANGKALQYLKAYASRMAENASRIASLVAFFEGRTTITTDDIKRAFMLVEYSTSERLRYLDASPNGEQNDSEKLSAWLVEKASGKNPPKLNRSYAYNGAPVPMRKNSRKLDQELSILESAGHIKMEKEGKASVIYINPNLYT